MELYSQGYMHIIGTREGHAAWNGELESAFVVSKDVQSLKMKGCGQSTFARLVIADFKAERDTR